MSSKDSFKTGSLEMLALKILSVEDCYGYQITQLIEEMSGGVITVPMGTMYPTLYKLAKKGYVSDYTKRVGERKERQYYHLEKEGEEELERLIAAFNETIRATKTVLSYKREDKLQKDVI